MVPYLWIKDQVARGCSRPSILLRLLQKGHYESGSHQEQVLVWTNAEFVMGGSDTVQHSLPHHFRIGSALIHYTDSVRSV